MDKAALSWLNNINAETWARHLFDNEIKVEKVTFKLAESLNSWVGKCRSMPIILLLEKIRLKLMFRFHDRYIYVASWETHTTPYVRELLYRSIEKSRHMRMMTVSSNEYQVFDGQTKVCVDLEKIKFYVVNGRWQTYFESMWFLVCITRYLT